MLEIGQEKRAQGQVQRAMDKLETLTGERVEMIGPLVGASANLSLREISEAQQYAAALEAESPRFLIPGDDVSRYRLWVQLDKRLKAGELLTADEARWWEKYPDHPDFVAMQQVFQSAG
ncbi:hypothetical protein D9M71_738100 [compost metagenome]